jgi:hypothetical protein
MVFVKGDPLYTFFICVLKGSSESWQNELLFGSRFNIQVGIRKIHGDID